MDKEQAPPSRVLNSFSQDIIESIEDESRKEIGPLYVSRWFPDNKVPGTYFPKDVPENGISVSKVPQEKAKQIYRSLFDEFKSKGYLIFLTNLGFDYDNPSVNNSRAIYDVAVIKAIDQYEIVKLINTEAPNYDITNEQIIASLKEWEEVVPFQISVVDSDRIEAEILELPENIDKFAIKIFDFCPDTVYQGAGSLKDLVNYIREEKRFWLWWD